ncbi:MAG: pilus assembly protein PilM [Planctomycetota bacterium]
MAKGVGLDIGEYEIKVVELDGSYRKPRLAKVSIDSVDVGDDEANRASEALHVLKDAGIARENVCLGFPCRESVLRTITVPFVGDDNIRKVVKFEVEGNIHSHNVDDMVVDFLTIEPLQNQTKVLVVAAPKAPLRARLKALEGVGIEPESVDLDATSLYRTADWLGCFADEPEAADAAAEAAPRVHLVIDVGARSSAVLVVVDGKLVDMRALRTGTESIVDEVAAHFAVSPKAAREAVVVALQTGRDQTMALPEPDAPVDEEADEEAAPLLAKSEVLPFAHVSAARDAFLERLRRELMRFLASVPQIHRVDVVWYTGGGTLLPGVVDVLRDVCESEPRPLDVLGRMQHGLDENEAAAVNPRIATAVGLALGMMGGPARLDLRREDLVFARRFDRIKFPLAVACMLGVFLLFFLGLRALTDYRILKQEYGWASAVDAGNRRAPKVTFQGYQNNFLRRIMTGTGIERRLDSKTYETLCNDLAKSEPFTALSRVREALRRFKQAEEEKTGYYADLSLESGYAVLVRMAEVLEKVGPQLGRYLVTDIKLTLPPQKDARYLEVTFALGQDFRTKLAAVKEAFAEDAKLPGSPFSDVSEGGPGDTKLFQQLEPGEEGAYMSVKVKVKPSYDVFQ